MTATDKLTLSVGLVGASLVTTGVGLIYPPAGFIVAGGFCLCWSFITARAAAAHRKGS